MKYCIDAEAESIIDQIREAFQNVPRGSLSLHQAMIARYESGERLAEAALLDRDQHWSEISDDDLETAGRAFYGADPLSWRYFIPAFMVWTLRTFRSNDLFVVDQTIYTFDLRSDTALERFGTLSPSQCKAVCRFLRYMGRNGEHADDVVANRALNAYWGKFCESDQRLNPASP